MKNQYNLPDDFDWRHYLHNNPDLIKFGINNNDKAVRHYLMFGKNENRRYSKLINQTIEYVKLSKSDIPNDFDYRVYEILNPDLKAFNSDKDSLINHYLTYGYAENRRYSCEYSYDKLVALKNNKQTCTNNKYIILINHESSLTGAPIFLQDLANWLYSNNFHNILFVDAMPSDNQIYKLNKDIQTVYHFNETDLLLDIIKKHNPIWIYSNSLSLIVRDIEAFDQFLYKTTFHFHECYEDIVCAVGGDIFNTLKERTSHIFFTTDSIRRDCNTDHKNGHVIPEFLPEERRNRILESIKKKPKRINKKPTIGMCGSICDRKNPKLFIEIAKSNPEYDFIWIGGKLENEIPENITNIDVVEDPYPYFNDMDYFLLTSKRDPCPIVILENMLINNKIILLDKNIKYEHDVEQLENVHIIKNHNNSSKNISKALKKIKLNTKHNVTDSNKKYILKHFAEPKIQIKKLTNVNYSNVLCLSYYADNKFSDLNYYTSIINRYLLFNPYTEKVIIACSGNNASKLSKTIHSQINLDNVNIIHRENVGWDIGGLIDILQNLEMQDDQYITYIHNKTNDIWRTELYKILYHNSHDIINYDTIVSLKHYIPCDISDKNRDIMSRHDFMRPIHKKTFNFISGTCFITKSTNLIELQQYKNYIKENLTNINTNDTFWQQQMMDQKNFNKLYLAHKGHLQYNQIDEDSRDVMIKNNSKNYFELLKKYNKRGMADYMFEHALERYIGHLITSNKKVKTI